MKIICILIVIFSIKYIDAQNVQCTTFFGCSLKYSAVNATLIKSSIVSTQINDPMPCCKLCSKKTNCNLFNVVYNNGNIIPFVNFITFPRLMFISINYFQALKRQAQK